MILVADDDRLVQQTCKHCLEAAGYTVAVVSSGAEALTAVASGKISTVLLDVFMPEMDGLETLLSIKKECPATSVVMMSGGGMRQRMDFLESMCRFGADAVVRKPFASDHLVSVVKRFNKNVWAA